MTSPLLCSKPLRLHILHLNILQLVFSCRHCAVNYAIIIDMKARYNYRIYPQSQQQTKLAQAFGCGRVVWNDALAIVKATPEGEKWPSMGDIKKQVTTQAKKTPERCWLTEVSSVVLQSSVIDLQTAFKNFFESRSGKRKGPKMGFPRFKSKHGKQAARFPSNGFKLDGNKLYLAKVGTVKVKWSRPLPAAPSSVTVTKSKAGQYHVSFVVEVLPIDVQPVRESIGIDLGIKVFGFPSVGKPILSPGYQRLYRKIARTSRRLARQQKGSNRWQVTKRKLAKLHLKVANLRKDFLHKQSTKLIRENKTVSLENLNVKGMLKNRRLSRAIAQQGWSTFRAMLEAKAKMHKDRTVSIISRWEPTSQTCSDCGFRWGKLDLSIRSVLCISCGAEHDRDQNAAKNIDQVGQELARTIKTQTLSLCKPPLGAVGVDASSQPYQGEQLCLSL